MQKLIKYIYGACILSVIGVCLFCNHMDYSYKKEMDYANWQYMALGAVIIGAVFWGIHLLQKRGMQIRRSKLWMGVLSILFFLGLVFCTYHYYFKTGWDAQMVEGAANMIAKGNYEDVQNLYFSFYPNNVFLVFIFSLIVRAGYLVGITNYYFCIILFQCFLFAAAGYLVYCIAEKLINSLWAVGIWVVYVLLAGLSPWVVIPYSDATGMVFPVFIFYLYLCIKEGKYVKCNLVLLAFTAYMGYHIKPQIVIVMIAIGLITGLEFLEGSGKERVYLLKKLVWPVAGLVIGFAVVTAGIKATGLKIDRERTFGMPHYLMMGLNYEVNGVINLEDQNFSMEITQKAERTAANLEVAVERVKEMGLPGLLELGVKKILTTFSDGTFAWWEEGNFYWEEMYDGIYSLRSILSGLYYEHGAHFSVFVNCMHTLWMGVVLFAGIVFIPAGKKREEAVLMLSLVGLFLFELLFEVRARYLFTYVPVFVLLAGIGGYYVTGRIAVLLSMKRKSGVPKQ